MKYIILSLLIGLNFGMEAQVLTPETGEPAIEAVAPIEEMVEENKPEPILTSKKKYKGVTNTTNGNPKKGPSSEKVYSRLGYKAFVNKLSADVSDEKVTEYKLEHYKLLANSYRLTGDTKNAEYAYAKVIESDESAIYYLYYAQALQSNKKYDQAKEMYLKYDDQIRAEEEDGEQVEALNTSTIPKEFNSEAYRRINAKDERGKKLAEACDRIQSFKDNKQIELKNVKALNGGFLDFSPSYYRDGIVFVSNRNDHRQVQHTDKWLNTQFMNLYYAEKNDEELGFGAPEAFSYEVTTKFHEGPVTFTKSGGTMYFTRNNFNNGKKGKDKKDIIRLKVYSAERLGDTWGDVKELPFNSEAFSVCHPTLSADGRKLYFASEAPGGYGGLDIYVSEMLNGSWSVPLNLGENVNSAGNELFPFIHDDGTLYFASNGHPGLGGLDIFSAVQTREDEDNSWDVIQNIGKPFNSSVDDFGLILDLTGKEGYLTSRRKGGYGEDDIYSFVAPEGLRNLEPLDPEPLDIPLDLPICVYDKVSGDPIEDATLTVEVIEKGKFVKSNNDDQLIVKLVPTNNGNNEFAIALKNSGQNGMDNGLSGQDWMSNASGIIDYPVISNKLYRVKSVKKGYITATKEMSSLIDDENDIDLCIPMEKDPNIKPCGQFEGIVLNKEYKNPVNKSIVTITNRCSGEKEELITDETGKFDFCYQCNCDYVLTADKENFLGDKKPLSTFNIDCTKPLEQKLYLSPAIDKSGKPLTLADIDPSLLKPGAIIELRNIFYDFDQDYIRDDAKPELEELIELLNKYPSMVISVDSHTDARASDAYNDDLSQRRAQSAVNYLLGRGVRTTRLRAKGWGENRLRNQCVNDKWCEEWEHQENRRTEFTIISFDNPENVKVRYDDNKPKTVDPKIKGKVW